MITHSFTAGLRAKILHVRGKGSAVKSATHAQLVVLSAAYACFRTTQVREAGTLEIGHA
jgi:hypothetical protein